MKLVLISIFYDYIFLSCSTYKQLLLININKRIMKTPKKQPAKDRMIAQSRRSSKSKPNNTALKQISIYLYMTNSYQNQRLKNQQFLNQLKIILNALPQINHLKTLVFTDSQNMQSKSIDQLSKGISQNIFQYIISVSENEDRAYLYNIVEKVEKIVLRRIQYVQLFNFYLTFCEKTLIGKKVDNIEREAKKQSQKMAQISIIYTKQLCLLKKFEEYCNQFQKDYSKRQKGWKDYVYYELTPIAFKTINMKLNPFLENSSFIEEQLALCKKDVNKVDDNAIKIKENVKSLLKQFFTTTIPKCDNLYLQLKQIKQKMLDKIKTIKTQVK